MELQFKKEICPYLRTLVSRSENQEQTQEIRLPDGMPDIGRILGCWGQVLIRGKEWQQGAVTVSGGVLVWVLYAPEDGTAPQGVDTWIPFQMKWDLPDSQRDGAVWVSPMLSGMDARCIAARKLLVRCNVSVFAEALEPSQQELFAPIQVPEDVQLQINSYPMELPLEAGEKAFQLQEVMTLPETAPAVEKILRYSVIPQIAEQRVMTNKLVFRGSAEVNMLYADAEGAIHTWKAQIPFSQFTELTGDFGANAQCWIKIAPTSMELEPLEERELELKYGGVAQYVVYDRIIAEVVEDAYSTSRDVKLQTKELSLPARLDNRKELLEFIQETPENARKILDGTWAGGHPQCVQKGDVLSVALAGQFQLLYQDADGQYQGTTLRQSIEQELPTNGMNKTRVLLQATEPVATVPGKVTQQVQMETEVFSRSAIPMVMALELGEARQPDPSRPSLILRRTNGQKLWELAKLCGSTVEAIQKANGLESEPQEDQMLLIPVR